MHLPMLPSRTARISANRRASDMFPGRVFHAQETRKLHERKYRDWDGWLDLVAEYRKEALHAKGALHENRPETFGPPLF